MFRPPNQVGYYFVRNETKGNNNNQGRMCKKCQRKDSPRMSEPVRNLSQRIYTIFTLFDFLIVLKFVLRTDGYKYPERTYVNFFFGNIMSFKVDTRYHVSS